MSLFIPDAGRGMGLRWVGPKGSGKTTGLIKICFQDFLTGKALVLLDAQGTASDLFVHLADSQPPSTRRELGKRIVLVDMSGRSGRIVPLPVYCPQGAEPLTATAERPLEAWRRVNPQLQSASRLGDNAMTGVGRPVGVILTALGWGIAEAEALVTYRERFRGRLEQLARDKPETAEAVAFLYGLPKAGSRDWHYQVDAYLEKVRDLTFDQASRAFYGAPEPGFAWDEVVAQGKAVLFDFRDVDSDRLRQFGAVWVFKSVLSYVQRRANRSRALVFCIDELLYFLSSDPEAQRVLAADFNHLVQTLARARSLWLMVAHQELNQLTKPMANVLMGMGSQVFGSSSDLEGGAEIWAKRFSPYDPHRKKAIRVIGGTRSMAEQEIPTYYTISEQLRLAAQDYQQLEPGCFYASISPKEGQLGGEPVQYCLPPFQPINDERVAINKQRLLERDGQPIETILAELAARVEAPPVVQESLSRPSPRLSPPVTSARSTPPPTPSQGEPERRIAEVLPPTGNVFRTRRPSSPR